VLFTGVLVLGNPAPSGAADAGAEGDFVARINSVRQSKGLAPLAVSGELTGVARRWTDRMAANGEISHNGNLSSEVSSNWRKLGENVARGSDVDSVWSQFVNSSGHYKNIVDPAFNYVGVGVSYDASGQLFTTHDFMAADGGGSPPPVAPASAPTQSAAPARATPRPAPAPEPEPEPEPEPPPPAPPPAIPARMHTMLAALRTADPPTTAAPPPGGDSGLGQLAYLDVANSN
jgi:hypothetical protein